mmetsp:Transcript_7930/g.13310  ORF Transcript_7930/g.13310 Transcript_7930/m.13310 type:complete len:111 (+) Transcript_7930:38-370(+)
MATQLAEYTAPPNHEDPWNWKMPGRASLMSLSKITREKDQVRAKTANGLRGRKVSSFSMYTGDIEGAQPKVYIPKEVKKVNNANFNGDIQGSLPRQLHIGLARPSTSLLN